ncbi:MAG: helix-turn-helix domain-containing protein [Clostridium sp.]
MKNLGRMVKKKRKEKNLTQLEVGEIAGISNSYISDIENGRTNPSIKSLVKICKALEIEDLSEIMMSIYVKKRKTAKNHSGTVKKSSLKKISR